MTTVRARIDGVGSYLPEREVTSREIEERIRVDLPSGWIERTTGVRARRFAPRELSGTDMAVRAVEDLFSRAARKPSDVDCLIYGAALPEVVEPASANIVQAALGLKVPVFDVNNACNGVFTAMHIADAFIRADVYECVLIAVGEKLSSVIPWHLIESNEKPMHHVSALTVGDAGGAVLVTRRESEAEESGRGILASKMLSEGALWEYCTLKGRGTLHPEDDSRDWLMCNARPLFNASLEYGPQLIREVLAAAHWDHADVDLIVPHQVSAEMLAALTAEFNRDTDFAVSTLPDVGNVAAANLPVTLEAARKDGRLKPNMKVFLGSGAAGFALGFAAVEW